MKMVVKENPSLQFTASEKAKQFAKKTSANCRMKKNLKQVYLKFALMQMKSSDIKFPAFVCKYSKTS